MESIQLRLGEANEITFGVNIQASKTVKPSYRFICEGLDGLSYSVTGQASSSGEVSFTLPALTEGQVDEQTLGRLEVIIDDRIYTPMHVQIGFERPTRVVAESVAVKVASKPTEREPVVTAQVSTARATHAVKKETRTLPKQKTLKERYEQSRTKR